MASVLGVVSARFDSTNKLAPASPPSGCAYFVAGTDADYPPAGLPQRRRTEYHWLGAWQDEGGLDAFLASPSSHIPQLDGAHAVRCLKLVPYMRRGHELWTTDVLAERPAADEPIAIISSIGSYQTEVDAIAASAHFHAARSSLADTEGLQQELLILPFPPVATDLFTITTWHNEAAARDWAYRGEAHRGATDYYKSAVEQPRVSFTRCRIAASLGTW